jgi:hypothetical protein
VESYDISGEKRWAPTPVFIADWVTQATDEVVVTGGVSHGPFGIMILISAVSGLRREPDLTAET